MEVFSIIANFLEKTLQVLNIKLKYLQSPSSLFILLLIIAQDLKFSRKCANVFIFQAVPRYVLVIPPRKDLDYKIIYIKQSDI